ncbi:MAG: MFS transporter [Natronomonas sp.]
MNWGYRHTVLTLCTLAFAATMTARLVISPVVPDISETFSVSTGAIGLALSGMWGAYALSQFPSGVLADRYGERAIIATAVGTTAVASLALAAAPTYAVFALMAVVLGAGAGLHYSVATTLLSKQFDDLGRAIGVHVAGGPAAGLVAPVAAAAVGSRYGFRVALAIGAVVAVPTLFLFRWRIAATPPARPDMTIRSRFEIGPLIELLARPEIRYTTALAVIGAFCWQATASFLPALFIGHHGTSAATAGIVFSVYFVVHGLTQPVMGGLSDRIGRESAAAIAFGSGVVGYAALAVGTTAVAMAAVPLVGVAMSWGAPIQSRFIDDLGDAERAAGFGLIRTVYMILGAFGSVVVGTTADVVGWGAGFGFLSLLLFVGFVGLLRR